MAAKRFERTLYVILTITISLQLLAAANNWIDGKFFSFFGALACATGLSFMFLQQIRSDERDRLKEKKIRKLLKGLEFGP